MTAIPSEDGMGALARSMTLTAHNKQVATSVAESLSGFGGYLYCTVCGKTQPLDDTSIATYLSLGWPKHHGYTMTWVTAHQEQGNDLANKRSGGDDDSL